MSAQTLATTLLSAKHMMGSFTQQPALALVEALDSKTLEPADSQFFP